MRSRGRITSQRGLPAIVRERLVGLGHAVSIFALADRGAAILGGLHQFGGKAMRHGLLATGSGGFDGPTHRERLATIGAPFARPLVRCAADGSGFYPAPRRDILQRLPPPL